MRTTLSLVFLIAILLLLVGCDTGITIDKSKLDAEENGYTNEFGHVIQKASGAAHSLYAALFDLLKFQDLQDAPGMARAQVTIAAGLDTLKSLSDNSLARLENTLPPTAMTSLHERLAVLLHEAPDTADPFHLRDSCLQFYLATKAFHDSLVTRPPAEVSRSPINLVYKPPLVPITIGLTPSFTVGLSIATPIGSFDLSHSNSSGIRRLAIVSGGKTRYFSLDRPFNVFVPTDYGINVSYQGAESLTITVVSRPVR